MKILLLSVCLFTLSACHSLLKEKDDKAEYLDSHREALQYSASLPLSKEIAIILSEEEDSSSKNKIFIKLNNILNQSLKYSEKCFELAEHSVKMATVAESYSDVSDCMTAFFTKKDFLYGVKLLSDLSDHRHLLTESDRKKFNLLSEINDKINMNILYINDVGSLAVAENAVIAAKAILKRYENKIGKTEKLEEALTATLESVEAATDRLRKTTEIRDQQLSRLNM